MNIIARNILGFSITSNMQRIMSINGCYASIMRAEKQKINSGKLPPGIPIPVLPVDYLLNKPDFWIGGEGAYVCPIESDWALWFNWQMNNNVAVLSSVKGINPLTGQRINGIGLEQYTNKCPVHNCNFLHGKFCPECNFKWPNQNYICHPNSMYLDGFRSEDGTVRQFYFTEDMTKSIPELVIGKEDTIPAFGFCFYKLQNDNKNYESGNRLKDIPQEYIQSGSYTSILDHVRIGRSYTRSKVCFDELFSDEPRINFASVSDSTKYSSSCSTDSTKYSSSTGATRTFYSSSSDMTVNHSLGLDSDTLDGLQLSEVGIGAGSQIKQSFQADKHDVKEWSEKPTGIIRVYFVFREQFERYVSSGLKDLIGHKECFLNNLPIGEC